MRKGGASLHGGSTEGRPAARRSPLTREPRRSRAARRGGAAQYSAREGRHGLVTKTHVRNSSEYRGVQLCIEIDGVWVGGCRLVL
jgi:hypothetical protein